MKPTVTVLGIAWFRPEQWQRLRDVSDDVDQLEATHADWLLQATRMLKKLQRNGIAVRKVDVDVEDLVAWCNAAGRRVDGAARADYTARQLQLRSQRSNS
jgi:hypothetical protein